MDDEPLNVKLLGAKRSAEKYETITAYSGEEALGKIRAGLPDLILLDVMMPNTTISVSFQPFDPHNEELN